MHVHDEVAALGAGHHGAGIASESRRVIAVADANLVVMQDDDDFEGAARHDLHALRRRRGAHIPLVIDMPRQRSMRPASEIHEAALLSSGPRAFPTVAVRS